ncbi:Cu(2+)-transporting P-type ATPase [Coemansia javaensis]|uniref:P-type Cu(+) transporter n=1 Tax=Coemansia javaensis TaxID=2761396 RepID=A0A9W8HI69_9FUNG|nr:Cu(2+)-transporting P-type ATPase [Coemansia javaensis]
MAVVERQVWSVQGMTCQSCVRSIEAAVGGLEGVASVSVSLADGQATVAYDPEPSPQNNGNNNSGPGARIGEAIEGCGFDAAAVPGSRTHRAELQVRGMTCQSCVRSIRDALGRAAGIRAVEDVSLEDGRATVVWDPAALDARAVAALIEACGFDVGPGDEPSPTPGPGAATVMEARVAVGGMTCQSCVSSVTVALQATAGVLEARVELAPRGLARVKYDPHRADAAALVAAIEDAGFDATLEDVVASGSSHTTIAAYSGHHGLSSGLALSPAPGGSSREDSTQPLLGRRTDAAAAAAGGGRLAAQSFSSTKSGETLLDAETVDVTGSHIATQFEVHGMTCSSCVAAIERGLAGRAGIHAVSVSLLAQRATVQHDSSVVSDGTIARWISELGFEAKALDGAGRVARVTLNVYGMTCASCVAAIERAVRREPGVASVSVSLALETAAIEYRPSEVGVRKLVAVVEGAGFDALVAQGAQNNTQLESLQRTRDILAWRRRFLQSLCFSAPVIVLAKVAPSVAGLRDAVHWQPVAGLPLGPLLQLALTTPLQFGVGACFYRNALKALRHGNANMDVLVTTGTSLAYFFSLFMLLWSALHGRHPRPHCFFEAPAMLITFVSLGRYLENVAKGNASAALSTLMTLTPAQATLVTPTAAGAEERRIPTDLIQAGDLLRVFPGERIPADGTLVEGASQVDEATVTGEAMPVPKAPGAALVAGTVNGTGSFTMQATRVGADTTVAQIVKLVEAAQTAKAPIQAYADRVARYFAPAVLLLGLATLLGWLAVAYTGLPKPALFQAQADEAGSYAVVCMKIAVAVVVVACPCALGLSTPTAVMVGTGVGAQLGVLIKGGEALEAASRIDVVVFDKTGTLTQGRLSVADLACEPAVAGGAVPLPQPLFVLLAGAAELGSEHPLGRAVAAYAQALLAGAPGGALPATTAEFDSVPGNGVSCLVTPDPAFGAPPVRVLVGSAAFLEAQGARLPAACLAAKRAQEQLGRTLVLVAVAGEYAGWLALSDVLRPEAIPAVATLQAAMGVECVMVTGDQPLTAQAVAADCGIARVYAGVSPAGKAAIVQQLQDELAAPRARGLLRRLLALLARARPERKRVAMVGDGVNDGAALAAADVGIAMKSGTDVAMEAASMVLMREDIADVVAALDLAQTIFRRIQWNYVWASVYNVLGIPLAMGLFIPIGIMMPPVFAGLAMAMSSLSVMASSLLLKTYRKPVCRAPSPASLPLRLADVHVLPGPRQGMRRQPAAPPAFVMDMSASLDTYDDDDEALELGSIEPAPASARTRRPASGPSYHQLAQSSAN